MGNRRLVKQAFLTANPMCCFCGGATPAVEEDHIPARSLFRQRQWPEGYVFPACAACNDASSLDELTIGWIVRVQFRDSDSTDETELAAALGKVWRRRPEWFDQMRELSRVETRKHLRERQLTSAQFPGGEVYVVKLPTVFLDALDRYAVKLGKALYYLHTGKILPSSGHIHSKALTNAEFMSPNFPLEKFEVFRTSPPMSRGNRDLSNQFAYRYGVPEEGGGAGFVVQFRESVAMLILVFEDHAKFLKRREALTTAHDVSSE